MSILDRFRLEDKKLFITGGSRGLGREMALAIADAGADVVLTGRNEASLEKRLLLTSALWATKRFLLWPTLAILLAVRQRVKRRWRITAPSTFSSTTSAVGVFQRPQRKCRWRLGAN